MTLATSAADITRIPAGLGVEDLWVLLQTVTDTTEQLQATHDTLHQQVARLQSELAEANHQLRRSRQLAALGEMAAGIAHELRNPLGSIQLYVQMLEEDLAGSDDHVELCQKINRAVTGLDSIVRDVLQFSRDTIIRPQRCSAVELFDAALNSSESLIRDRHIHIQRNDKDDLVVHCDTTLMTQALTNIIRNAVEAAADSSPDQPCVALSTCCKIVRCPSGDRQMRVVLAVQDNGPGVSDDIIKRMFNPFFTTRATGTGLGLAIVHRIIDAHGGHINVHNIEVSGARFELCLPLEVVVDTASPAPGPQIEIKTSSQALRRNAVRSVSEMQSRQSPTRHTEADVPSQAQYSRSQP